MFNKQEISAKLPEFILKIINTFHEAGYKSYLVGGCVRNILLKKEAKDWDITTNAVPETILKLFPDGFYDNPFGTVGVSVTTDNGESTIVEITTFRSESGYTDRRHPETVTWGKTIEEDLNRRDFTMNAIALEIKKDGKTNIIDPFNGQEDIKSKVIRTVSAPDERFKEDALRLMRAIRFAAQLSFDIDPETLNSIGSDAPLLKHIAKERIHAELIKILASDNSYEGIMLLYKTNLLEYIIPELLKGVGVSQIRPGRHHNSDVFTHNLLSLKLCPSNNPVVRFAALIHDIGKPYVKGEDNAGLVIFHNHEIAGAKIAAEICDRLKFSKKDKQQIVTLVRWHMFTVDEHITDSAIRRFIRRIGVGNVEPMIAVRIGDRLGSGTETAESWRLKLFKKRLEEQLAPAPFSIKDLAINGNDIMKELNLKPGKKVGEILQKLFEEVDEDLEKNTKEYLIKRVHEL